MRGKSFSIPFTMKFKVNYCSCCGTKLKTERTYRIVSKDDKDYYQYQDYGSVISLDYDVYNYHFKCPSCDRRFAEKDQRIIRKIQRIYKKKVLSNDELKDNYENEKNKVVKRVLLKRLIFSIVVDFSFFLFLYLQSNRELKDLITYTLCAVILAYFSCLGVYRNHLGKGKLRKNQSYSYEKKLQLERLHSYAYGNRKLIESSSKCCCFYCKEKFPSSEVVKYINDGNTAICPKCKVHAVLPDIIDEKVDKNLLDEMNQYWF